MDVTPTLTDGRAPQGARGLKFERHQDRREMGRRAPQGARGLKFVSLQYYAAAEDVAPRKGRVG